MSPNNVRHNAQGYEGNEDEVSGNHWVGRSTKNTGTQRCRGRGRVADGVALVQALHAGRDEVGPILGARGGAARHHDAPLPWGATAQ